MLWLTAFFQATEARLREADVHHAENVRYAEVYFAKSLPHRGPT